MKRAGVNHLALLILLVSLTTLLAQDIKFVLVRQIMATLPEALYKSVGSKTFNVQYVLLFLEQDYKAYIVKAWSFKPTGPTFTYNIKLIDPTSKKSTLTSSQAREALLTFA